MIDAAHHLAARAMIFADPCSLVDLHGLHPITRAVIAATPIAVQAPDVW